VYEDLYRHWRALYFAFGRPESEAVAVGEVLPSLRALRARISGAAG
jgi:hypothetical protein